MKKIIKLDRFSAWVLFATMLAYFVSGYGMTKGIISQDLASKLHLSVLTYIILAAFVVHTAYAIRLAFIRWRFWNVAGKTIWWAFYVLFISLFIFIDRFYSPPQNSGQTTANGVEAVAVNTVAAASSITTTPTNSTKIFNSTELAKYDGKNGTPAYVAVDGLVYDLTSVFQDGYHFGHVAGRDLTNAFYSRHVKSAVSKYPVVGEYQN